MTEGRDAQALGTVLASLVVLIVAAVLFLGRTIPIISADELGYLADAQYLAGRGAQVNMGYSQFYFGGHAVLLAPLSWLFADPRTFYQAAVLLNAPIMAATVPVLVRLAGDFGFARHPLTPWLAAVLVFWPSQLFQAYLALPEISLRLIMLLLVTAAFAMVRQGSLRNVLLVALFAVLAYAFHPRSIVVLPITVLLLLVCAVRRSISWTALATGIGVIAVGYFAVGRFNAFLQAGLWLHEPTAAQSVVALARLMLEEPLAMALRSFGHGWYQVVATLLLVPFGLIVMAYWIAGQGPAERRIVSIFVLLMTLGIGAAGSSNMIQPETIDWLIYSRFLDVLTPVIAWVGVLAISEPEWRTRLSRWLPWLAAGSVAGGVLLYLRYRDSGLAGPNLVEVGSLAPFVQLGVLGSDTMARTMLFGPLILVLVAVAIHLASRHRAGLLIGLIAFCLFMTAAIDEFYRGANTAGEKHIADMTGRFAEAGDAPVHLDRSVSGGEIYKQQYVLARYFPPIDVHATPPTDGTVAVVAASWLQGLNGTCLAKLDDDSVLVRFGGTTLAACPQ